MEAPRITPEVLDFLRELKVHNEREWFEENRDRYQQARQAMTHFSDALKDALGTHDQIDSVKHFRIHRDLRFSPDKTPYKPHFAVSFSREGARRRGGYYLRIRPGESFVACGFWDPDKKDLLRIRQELQRSAAEFREATGGASFRERWGELQGETVRTAPKGFERDHPDIDLIRRKQFIFTHAFADREVLAPDFLATVNAHYREVRPFFDLMSEILTTNLDGESLLDE